MATAFAERHLADKTTDKTVKVHYELPDNKPEPKIILVNTRANRVEVIYSLAYKYRSAPRTGDWKDFYISRTRDQVNKNDEQIVVMAKQPTLTGAGNHAVDNYKDVEITILEVKDLK